MGYNEARNPIGIVPNVLLASAPGKEIHPQILRMLVIHGDWVEKDISNSMLICHNKNRHIKY